jgi:hypothetical protein
MRSSSMYTICTPSMCRSPDLRRGHFPSLVLTLGEPHPGSLAERMRSGVRSRFGRGAAVFAKDTGDLRIHGVLGVSGGIDVPALERWLASTLHDLLDRHCGDHPARPQLTILLVADADDPLSRTRFLASVHPLNRVVNALALPAGLAPRVTALIGWPDRDSRGEDAASRAAWLRDVEHLVTCREVLSTAIVVSRSNYRPDRASNRLALHTHEGRNAAIVEQACLLMSTALLEEALSLGRGRTRTAFMAIGSTPLENPDHDSAWPWVSASDGDWGGWFPSPVHWALGAGTPARDGHVSVPRFLAGSAERPLRITCLPSVPLKSMAGYAEWEAAYLRLDLESRRRLHRFPDACPAESGAEPPGLPQEAPFQPEMVP